MKSEEKRRYQAEQKKLRVEQKDNERKSKKRTRKAIIFYIAGGLLMFAGIIVVNIPPDWTKTTGEITEKRYKFSSGKNSRHWVEIKYRYLPSDKSDFVSSEKWCFPSTFKKFNNKSRAMSFMSSIKKGDLIKIWHNPDNNIQSTCNMRTEVKYPKTGYGLIAAAFFISISCTLWFFIIPILKKRRT